MILLGAIPFVKYFWQVSEKYSAIAQKRDGTAILQSRKVNYYD